MSRKITILGMGPTAMERKVVMDQFCVGERWSLNNAYNFYGPEFRFDRFFELHCYRYLHAWKPAADESPIRHFERLNALDCPVYVTEPLPVIRNQVDYNPVQVMRHHQTNYFLGSPSLMLALALYEHDHGHEVEEIRSWGIDTSDPSHAQQRHSWAFWLSKAQARGIRMSGTAQAFFSEYEKDDGLRGLREAVGDQLVSEQVEINANNNS